jgi:hypothetical protein
MMSASVQAAKAGSQISPSLETEGEVRRRRSGGGRRPYFHERDLQAGGQVRSLDQFLHSVQRLLRLSTEPWQEFDSYARLNAAVLN